MGEEFEKLRAIIADVTNVDPEEITPETTFTDDLCADSIDLHMIRMGIEEEFGLTVDDETAEKIATVGEALELIKGARGDA